MAGFGSRDDYERIRLSRARLLHPSADPEGGGFPSFVGRVTSGGSALGVGKFLMVQPLTILGGEGEGVAGVQTANPAASVPVLLLGPGIPATGDSLVCRFVNHRWVAERSGNAGGLNNLITIPTCSCPVPTSLRMTSASTTCNYGMFQDATLTWQAPPACFAPLNIVSNIFMSTTTFNDVFGNVPFYYYLYCQYNQFFLTRIYCTSPYGSPYRDAALYSWLIGGYGNNCSPFYLHNGAAFPGSDATCSVSIDPS